MSRSTPVLVAAVAAGCARTAHVATDLQLDVESALPDDADTVRICVTDGPWRDFPARDGRFAFAGLPTDAPEVVVFVADEGGEALGVVGPVVLEDAYTTAALADCDGCTACEPDGDVPPEGAPSWTLATRFVAP